tara:strand:+ start:868 stop:2106 length:1239 start_codon:yes stop_codon:yes gene_type:complete
MSLSIEWVKNLPQPKGILREIQINARDSILKEGLPTKNIESWRLTNFEKLDRFFHLPHYLSSINKKASSETISAPKPNSGIRLIIKQDGHNFEDTNLPLGIQLLNNKSLEKHLNNNKYAETEKSSLQEKINHALTSQILALKISGEKVPPIELVVDCNYDSLFASKILIFIEENTKCELLLVSSGSNNSANSQLLELHIGKNAEVKHGWISIGEKNSIWLGNLSVRQEVDSNYRLTSIQSGWDLCRFEPKIIQLNGKAKTLIKSLQFSRDKQQLATHSYVRFDGAEGSLDQLQKSISSDNSHSIFNGAIEVPRVAQKTNAAQLSRNLLMSKKARIDTKPELEIIADDVRCAHGATISQLQEDELFYLKSRGISHKQATKLLLRGYCQEILNTLPVEAKRWKVLQSLLDDPKE